MQNGGKSNIQITFLLCVLCSCGNRTQDFNKEPKLKMLLKDERNHELTFDGGGKVFNRFDVVANSSTVYLYKETANISGIGKHPATGFHQDLRFDDKEVPMLFQRWYHFANGRNSSREIIAYNEGATDESNSMYLDISVVKEASETVEVDLAFIGAYEFISGDLFCGRKMYELADSLGTSKHHMLKQKQRFVLKKSKINNRFLDITVLVNRSIGPNTRYLSTTPGVGNTFYTELFVRTINLD